MAAWVALAAAVVLLFAADTFKASQPMTPTFEVRFGMWLMAPTFEVQFGMWLMAPTFEMQFEMWLMAPTLEAEVVAGAAVGSIP